MTFQHHGVEGQMPGLLQGMKGPDLADQAVPPRNPTLNELIHIDGDLLGETKKREDQIRTYLSAGNELDAKK